MVTIDEMMAVLQAHKEGKIIQCRRSSAGTWQDLDEPSWNFGDFHYRIKPLSKPSINWEHVRTDFKFLVKQLDGKHYLFAHNIKLDEKFGWYGDGEYTEASVLSSFVPGDCDWKDSLVERP